MLVMLLTEHYLDFLSLKGGCTGSSDSIHVKLPHCWKSHVAADYILGLSVLIVHCWEQNGYIEINGLVRSLLKQM